MRCVCNAVKSQNLGLRLFIDNPTGIIPSIDPVWDGSVAEWLACWTQAQKGLGSNRSRDAVR